MKRKSTLLIVLVILSLMVEANTVYGAAGDLLWEKNITPPINYNRMNPQNVCISQSFCIFYATVYQYISGNPVSFTNQSIFIQAFDMATGIFKWERIIPYNVDTNLPYLKATITINGNIIYIASLYQKSNINYGTIGALNANSGETLWQKPLASPHPYYDVIKMPNNSETNINYITTFYNLNQLTGIIRTYHIGNITSSGINSLLLDK
jgi:outer membrane protein assembly factor BamB